MPQLVDILLFTVLDPRASRFERRKRLLRLKVGEGARRAPSHRYFGQYNTFEAFSERYYVVRVSLLAKSKQRFQNLPRPLIGYRDVSGRQFCLLNVLNSGSRSFLYVFHDFSYIDCRARRCHFPMRMTDFNLSLTIMHIFWKSMLSTVCTTLLTKNFCCLSLSLRSYE